MVALLVDVLADGYFTTVGQDFARVCDRVLLGTPADFTSLLAVVVGAVISGVVFWAGLTCFRRQFCSPAWQA